MKKIWLLLSTAVTILSLSEGARFLAFLPFPVKSHQRIIQPLLRALAERGHQVVSYTPFPLDNPPNNYQAIKLPDYIKHMQEFSGDQTEKESYEKNKHTIWPSIQMLYFKQFGVQFSDWALKLPEVQDLIKSNQKFDAIIMETTFIQESFIAFGHKFKAPVIEYVPAGNIHWSYWLHGNPVDTSYLTEMMIPFTDSLSFHQRVINFVLSWLNRLVFYQYYMPLYQRIADENIRYDGWTDRPSITDMISNTSLVLLNSHISSNYPHPLAPHYKEVGGLNIAPTKPLPKDIQDFMDGAKDGVIYFTLGSHVDVSGALASNNLINVFLRVFGQAKQRVLWKWEQEFPDLPSNIKISKWFPQQDILAHKNLKLFITHGGLLSITEAINQGVPTIGIPIMAEQFKNVEHMKKNKYGIQLYLDNVTFPSLKWAVEEIINNPEYRKNAKKQSELFRDKPETAMETAIYWTEYVIRHKGAHHLRPAIATMPWYQQAMLDVYTVMAIMLLLPIYIVYKLFKCILRYICCRTNKNTSKNQIKYKKNK